MLTPFLAPVVNNKCMKAARGGSEKAYMQNKWALISWSRSEQIVLGRLRALHSMIYPLVPNDCFERLPESGPGFHANSDVCLQQTCAASQTEACRGRRRSSAVPTMLQQPSHRYAHNHTHTVILILPLVLLLITLHKGALSAVLGE